MSDIEKIKQLRQSTGAGFKDCNSALKESNGDLQKAVEILRVKGITKASKKMSREAKEGVIVFSGDENKSSLLEVNCETDFVAKNEDFIKFVKELSELNNQCSSDLGKLDKSIMQNKKTVNENLVALIAKIGEKITIGKAKTIENINAKNFSYQHSIFKDNVSKLGVIVSIENNEQSDKVNSFGKQLAMHIAASNPIALTSDNIQKEIIDKEQELISEELKNSGKSEEIAKKISLGKLNKFKEENSLMTQDWVMDPKKKVKEVVSEVSTKGITIKEFVRLKIGD
jgi:elongation factor Ts